MSAATLTPATPTSARPQTRRSFVRDTRIVLLRELRPVARDPFSLLFGLIQPLVFLGLFGPLLVGSAGAAGGLGEPPDTRVVEVHPELSFRALDGRVTDRKSSVSGLAQRIRALQQVMDVLDALSEDRTGLPVVDALDACAAAWSARRLVDGHGQCVGDGSTDGRGRPMRICW